MQGPKKWNVMVPSHCIDGGPEQRPGDSPAPWEEGTLHVPPFPPGALNLTAPLERRELKE